MSGAKILDDGQKKEGKGTRVYGYFVILDFLKSIYMLYYIICITYIICYIIYIYVNIDSRIDYSFF